MKHLCSSLFRFFAVALAVLATSFVQAAPMRDWSTMSSTEARAEMANLIPQGERAKFEAKAGQTMTFGDPAPVYRFYNTATRTHFYTISEAEKQYVVENYPTYVLEGEAYWSYPVGTANSKPVYRFYNTETKAHFYTVSDQERDLVRATYKSYVFEGVAFHAFTSPDNDTSPMFRFYNLLTRTHFYTITEEERDGVIQLYASYIFEGSGFHACRKKPGPRPVPPGDILPTITLATDVPAEGVVAPATIVFTATAADADGSVKKVEFYSAGRKIGEVNAAPWTFTWTGVKAGDYRFTAKATDDKGGSTLSAMILLTVKSGTPPPGNMPPTITLASMAPAGGYIAPANVVLTAEAMDADGTVKKVEFFKNGSKIGEALAAPWTTTYMNLGAGDYTFTAKATDDDGASTMSAALLLTVKTGATADNKPPKVAIKTPTTGSAFAQPATIALTAEASDPDGTVAKVEYFSGTTKLGEAMVTPWSVTWSGVVAGSYSLTAVATDNLGATTTSSVVSVAVSGPPPVVDVTTKDAARFLTQATFGIQSIDQIAALQNQGYDAWLNQQFAMQAGGHVDYINARVAAGDKPDEERAYEAIWQQWLNEPGQLRARMSFALSQIFVISNIAPDLNTYAMSSYMDMLNRNAFGNYRQLLEDVTLHPAMGYYLNMIQSKKEDPAKGTHPNENYAREVNQLFSIGLVKLNQDGTRQLDGNGAPIPTYDQSVVQGFAAAFTGWNFAGSEAANPRDFDPAKENWLQPMEPWESYHDKNPKTLLDGFVTPANQTARQDMKIALDTIFNHPNVGPFIGRELIQRLVTSNPSPAYIGRVAAAFANNGAGVRGDLRAVVRAVLMDPEARDLSLVTLPTWGKQREPVIRFANLLRGFNAASPSGRNKIWYLDSADEGLNQSPLLAPSVFNFFSPNYRQPGPLAAAGLSTPEFQITTETSMVGGLNFFYRLVKNGYYGDGDTRLTLNYALLNSLAADPPKLVDQLNMQFYCGLMGDQTRTVILNALNAITGSNQVRDRVRAALTLMVMSPEFVIQK